MSLYGNLNCRNKMYVIPKGCSDINQVVQIVNDTSTSVRIACYFNSEDYQVITDETLKEREIDLKKYIEQTESWRTKNVN